jgi:hypothetical protein
MSLCLRSLGAPSGCASALSGASSHRRPVVDNEAVAVAPAPLHLGGARLVPIGRPAQRRAGRVAQQSRVRAAAVRRGCREKIRRCGYRQRRRRAGPSHRAPPTRRGLRRPAHWRFPPLRRARRESPDSLRQREQRHPRYRVPCQAAVTQRGVWDAEPLPLSDVHLSVSVTDPRHARAGRTWPGTTEATTFGPRTARTSTIGCGRGAWSSSWRRTRRSRIRWQPTEPAAQAARSSRFCRRGRRQGGRL